MINIGKLTFDLGVNMGSFAQNLTQAGAAISSFAAKNTQSFAGARQQFAQYRETIGQHRQTLLAQQEAIRDLIAAEAKQVQALDAERQQLTRHQAALAATRNDVKSVTQTYDDLNAQLKKGQAQRLAEEAQLQSTTAALAKQRAEVQRLDAAYKGGTATRAELGTARTERSRLIGREQYQRRTLAISTADVAALSQQADHARQVLTALTNTETAQATAVARSTEAVRDQNTALHTTTRTLLETRNAFADTQEAVGRLEQQARRQPGTWRRSLDAVHSFATTTSQRLETATRGVQDFTRGFERLSRGIRGVTPQMARAQDEIYRLQLRIRNQATTIERAEIDYKRYGDTILATQKAIATSEARLAQRRETIARVEATVAYQQYRLQVMMAKGAPQTAIALQERRISEVQAALVKWRHDLETTDAYLVRQRTTLERLNAQQKESKGFIDSSREAYTNLQSRLKEATTRMGELGQRQRETAARQKAVKQTTDEQRFSLDLLIARLLGWVRGSRQAGDSSARLGSQLRVTQVEVVRMGQSLSRLGQFVRDTLVVTLGTTLGNVLGGVAARFRQVIGAGVGQVQSFEQLTFSINALLAKEYRAGDATVSFSEAMQRTRADTSYFTEQIEQLGIQSTFTSQELTGVFKSLLRTFGSEEALHITKTLSGFGDVMSASGYDLEGISTALGQIQTKGKVQLEEINQLQERNVDALGYLARAYGKTKAEIQSMISAGQILAKDAIPAIVNGLQQDFAGAGEEASKTFKGLTSSIMDLSQRALRTTFTPMMEALRPLLIRVVAILSNPAIIAQLAEFGEVLGEKIAAGLEWIADIAPTVIDQIASFADTIPGALSAVIGFAEEAYVWGSDIVQSFLDGMLSKVDSISEAASWIGDELSYWMEPHSPPRIAPNLDTWGEQTAQTYFDGMANADGGRALTALGAQVSGATPVAAAPGTAAAASGGAAMGTLDATNNILTYIAGLFERFLATWEQTARGAGGGSRGGGGGGGGAEGAEGGTTAEYFRQLNEQRLSGSRTAASASNKEQRAAEQAFDAEIRHAEAIGDHAHALDLLREKLSGVEEGSKEYFDTQTKIEKINQKIEREGQSSGKRRATTSKANANAAKQDFYAQVNYLTKTGETDKALVLLEQRQATLRKNSKEWYDLQLKIDKLRKGGTEGAGIGYEGMTGREEGGGGKGMSGGRQMTSRFQALLDRVRAQAAAFRQTLAPITQWVKEHQQQIGFLLTTIAIRLARAFVVARVIPVLREVGRYLGIVGASMVRMITPLGLLKVAVNLFAIAWIRNWGGIREIAARLLPDVIPHIERLRQIIGEIFGPSNAGMSAKIRAFVARLPEIRAELKAVFDRIGAAFVEWIGPLSGKLRFQMEQALAQFVVWVREKGGGQLIDAIDRVFADVVRWLEGQDPQTFIVGVVAKLTATIATVTQVMIAGLVAVIGGLIIAYGPQIAARMSVWADRIVAWIDDAAPKALIALSNFVGVLGLGILSGAVELGHFVGKFALKLTSWILPAIPKAISLLLDFIVAIGAWFINVGSYQLGDALGDFIGTALNSLAKTLPRFGLALGRALGRLVTQALALIGFAVINLPTWLNRFSGFLLNTLLPALGQALLGLGRGLAAAVGGVIIGIFDPIVEVIRTGEWVQSLLAWVKSFGIDFLNTFIDGLGIQVPEVLSWLARSFESVVSQFRAMLGIATRTDRVRVVIASFRRDLSTVPPELRGINQVLREGGPIFAGAAVAAGALILRLRGIIPAGSPLLSWLTRARGGSGGLVAALRAMATWFVNLGKTIVTQTIPAIARFVQTGLAAAISGLRALVGYITAAVMAALKALAVALVNLASTHLRGTFAIMVGLAIQRLGDLVIAIRTNAIPAFLDMAKTAIASAAKALWSFIVMIWQQGIPGLIAMARQGIANAVTGLVAFVKGLHFSTAAMKTFLATAIPLALIAAAIAGIAWALNDFNQKIDNATQKLLTSRKWWNESTEAMQRYAGATEDVQLATLDQAEAVKQLRDEIQNELADLGRRMSARLVSEEQYKREMDAINAKAARLKIATKVLDDEILAQSRHNAMVKASIDGYNKWNPEIADTTEEFNALANQINDTTTAIDSQLTDMTGAENTFRRDREQSWREHTDTMNGITSDSVNEQVELADAHRERMRELQTELGEAVASKDKEAIKSIQARQAAENLSYQQSVEDLIAANLKKKDEEAKAFAEREQQAALAYVKERAEQKRHLGQLLIDYIREQVNMGRANENRGAAVIDQIAKEYGVQQTITEQGALDMRRSLDAALKSTSGDTSRVTEQLNRTAEELRKTEELRDKLREEITSKIVTDFQKQGKYDPDELNKALERVPELIEVEIKTRLNDQTGLLGPGAPEVKAKERARLRRMGGQISDDMMDGIDDGTTKNGPRAQQAGARLADNTTKGTKNKLEVHSPSGVFRRIAHQTVEGFEVGMQERMARMQTVGDVAMGQLATSAPRAAATARATAGALTVPGGSPTISMPITITGNTVRSNEDLKQLENVIMTKVVRAIDTIVLQGLK